MGIVNNILLVIYIGCVCLLGWRYRRVTKELGDLHEIKVKKIAACQQLNELNAAVEESDASLKKLDSLIDFTNAQIAQAEKDKEAAERATLISHNERRVAEEKRNAAIELAEKDLELEREKRLQEFNKKLDDEAAALRESHEVTRLKKECEELNAAIEESRQKLQVWQKQMLNAQKEEDFINFHSIELSPQDLKDIELIRSFAPQLTRQEAFHKIIWTEYIQRPIQALCKTLGVEKITGIYKVTHIESGRMYIGQAVDIAARWKEHCKCGLGIGTTSYMGNKFYKALHNKGIENFTWEVLEACPRDKLNEREFYWIDVNNATTFGFNSKVGG